MSKKHFSLNFITVRATDFLACTASRKDLAGEKYYKLSPKSILELDGEIRCYYEGRSLDPNCGACKSLGKFSF